MSENVRAAIITGTLITLYAVTLFTYIDTIGFRVIQAGLAGGTVGVLSAKTGLWAAKK